MIERERLQTFNPIDVRRIDRSRKHFDAYIIFFQFSRGNLNYPAQQTNTLKRTSKTTHKDLIFTETTSKLKKKNDKKLYLIRQKGKEKADADPYLVT